MRLIFAAFLLVWIGVPPAEASRARDGFGHRSRCHCDRYLNPHYTDRTRPAYGSFYPGPSYRRY